MLLEAGWPKERAARERLLGEQPLILCHLAFVAPCRNARTTDVPDSLLKRQQASCHKTARYLVKQANSTKGFRS
jgi:hypothetical protein